MPRYFLARLVQMIPVIIGTTLLTFMLLEVVPGDPVTVMMREHIDADVVARVRTQMQLDDPWPRALRTYMWDAAHGDFGTSYKIQRSVSELLIDAFPKTLALTFAALIFAWGIGIPAGIVGGVEALLGAGLPGHHVRFDRRIGARLLVRAGVSVDVRLEAGHSADQRLGRRRIPDHAARSCWAGPRRQ